MAPQTQNQFHIVMSAMAGFPLVKVNGVIHIQRDSVIKFLESLTRPRPKLEIKDGEIVSYSLEG